MSDYQVIASFVNQPKGGTPTTTVLYLQEYNGDAVEDRTGNTKDVNGLLRIAIVSSHGGGSRYEEAAILEEHEEATLLEALILRAVPRGGKELVATIAKMREECKEVSKFRDLLHEAADALGEDCGGKGLVEAINGLREERSGLRALLAAAKKAVGSYADKRSLVAAIEALHKDRDYFLDACSPAEDGTVPARGHPAAVAAAEQYAEGQKQAEPAQKSEGRKRTKIRNLSVSVIDSPTDEAATFTEAFLDQVNGKETVLQVLGPDGKPATDEAINAAIYGDD